MIFSEIYGAYYNTIAAIISEAVEHPKTVKMQQAVKKHAFEESWFFIDSAIKRGDWPVIRSDGTTKITHRPTMPLTNLQKSWLLAIARDPRVRLFGEFEFDFPGVEPLFTEEDIEVFDRYSDGDSFTDENYIKNFRLILDAIKNGYALNIETRSRRGEALYGMFLPERLEYSEKDDKFRVYCAGGRFGRVLNLNRIVRCEKSEYLPAKQRQYAGRPASVVFELTDRRNALERVLMHFSHFRREAEKTGTDTYRITVYYDSADEIEMVIRVLAYGPMIRVISPESFVGLIRERLREQAGLLKTENIQED